MRIETTGLLYPAPLGAPLTPQTPPPSTDGPAAMDGDIRPAVDALLRAAILRGDGASGPQGSRIDLSREQLRTLTLVYRGGGFDRALKKAGLPPAVPD